MQSFNSPRENHPTGPAVAAGMDIGGTKIAAQLFDPQWRVIAQERIATPKDYRDLVTAVATLSKWADAQAGIAIPIGIGTAGLLNPQTGHLLAANLAASSRPFPADINTAFGRPVTFMNDSRAMALSEAVFGAGKGLSTVVSLILGTGVGGGLVIDGTPTEGPTLTGGEFGHMSAPAHIITNFGLPIHTCGCGRQGCIETYIAGPALTRMAKDLTGQEMTPHDIAARRASDMAQVWAAWCELVGDLIVRLTLTVDPDLIVVGGGLSQIDGLISDLSQAALGSQMPGFTTAPLALAQGGNSSGARGAAYAAWRGGTV